MVHIGQHFLQQIETFNDLTVGRIVRLPSKLQRCNNPNMIDQDLDRGGLGDNLESHLGRTELASLHEDQDLELYRGLSGTTTVATKSSYLHQQWYPNLDCGLPEMTMIATNSSSLHQPLHSDLGRRCLPSATTMTATNSTILQQQWHSNLDHCCGLSVTITTPTKSSSFHQQLHSNLDHRKTQPQRQIR